MGERRVSVQEAWSGQGQLHRGHPSRSPSVDNGTKVHARQRVRTTGALPHQSQPLDSPPMSDDSTRAMPRWLPHPLVIHVIVLGIVLYAAFLWKGPWDSDFYWHLPTGRLIAEGKFPRTDPFSFTWGGMPWTLHEWLGELFLFQLVDKLGYMGAVYVFGLIPASPWRSSPSRSTARAAQPRPSSPPRRCRRSWSSRTRRSGRRRCRGSSSPC